MANPIKRDKTITPTIISGIDVPGQGHVPGPSQETVSVPGSPPKGDMKAKGFGLMMRSQMYKVR
jgi:hypothetical protein